MQPVRTTDALLYIKSHHLGAEWQYMRVRQLQDCAVPAGEQLNHNYRTQLHPAPPMSVSPDNDRITNGKGMCAHQLRQHGGSQV